MTERTNDNTITIGIKSDDTYLKTILRRLRQKEELYIKVFNFPEQLAKVDEYYHYLKWFGIREMDKRDKEFEPSNRDPNIKLEVIIIKWKVVGRLMKYREDNKDYLQSNEIL